MNSTERSNVPLVTIALFVATFMSAVEGTIVSTAMPTIIGDLQGVSLMNWVFSIFLLTNAIATPIYGKLADQVGRKPMFIIGIAIFIVGSVMSGLSHSMLALIIWRAVQGIGAGSIMPISNTIIADIYPVEKRAQVMGFNGAAWGIASIIAPLLGGFIVDQLTWHWIFFINLPIGIILMLMIQLFFKEQRKVHQTSIDYLGMIYLTLSLLSLMYGFQAIGQAPIKWPIIAICLLIFVVTLILFIRHERIAADPLIPMELFENKTFVVQNAVVFLVSGFLIGFEVYLPDWTQGILGLRASMAGFAITPSSIMWIVGSFIAGKMVLTMRPQMIINVSLSFILVGAIAMTLLPAQTPFWSFLIIAAICGTGFGITNTSTTITVQNEVKPDEIGVATSFNTLCRTLGQSLMVSIFGIIMNTTMVRGVNQTDGATMGMMDKLINPQTAHELSQTMLPKLRIVLYQMLHNVFIAGLILIVLAFLINFADRNKKSSTN